MNICRFIMDGKSQYGLYEGDKVLPMTSSPFEEIILGKSRYDIEEVSLLAPVEPTKVVAVGLNYTDHAREVNLPLPEEPLLFLKPSSAVIGPEKPIILPKGSKRVDYEAELAVVIGKRCRRVSAAEAQRYILGYTCLNDVTERIIQAKDHQWTRAKSFDTFCPLGPVIATDIRPEEGLKIEAVLNGQVKQASSTSNLIFTVPELVSFISQVMTLLPGDVIATGTPSGVGPLHQGDTIEIRIEGIGSLTNPVEAEQ